MTQDLISNHQKFVQIRSYSGEEGELAKVLQSTLKGFHFDEVWADPYGNVIGKKVGRKKGKTIVFEAHMDEVPVDESQWSYPPFGGVIDKDCIWGRGSTDTKGSLAAMVSAIGELDMKAMNGTVYVVGSVGEEVLEGAAFGKVAEALKPDLVVIGEPTDCKIGISQKGRAKIVLTALGKPAHSSVPEQGENAAYKAAEMIRRIQKMSPVEDLELGAGIMELIDITSLPYPSLSTLPYECKMNYDRRLLIGETSESIKSIYSAVLKDVGGWKLEIAQIYFKTYTGYEFNLPDFHPAWRIERNSSLVECVQNGVKNAGIDPELIAIPFCTDGSVSAGELHYPAVVFGPSAGELSHSIDENIKISELIRGYQGYQGIARSLLSS